MQTHRYLLLLAVFLGGCYGIESYKVHPTRYHVFEDGSVKKMHLVLLDEVIYAPPIGGWKGQARVLTEAPPKSLKEAGAILDDAPGYRCFGARNKANFGAVMLLARDALVGKGFDPPQPIYWVISLHPEIVARGTKIAPPYDHRWQNVEFLYGDPLRLVSDRDWDELANVLFILDRSPPEPDDLPGDTGGEKDKRRQEAIRNHTRQIELNPPLRLSDIMQNINRYVHPPGP